ncbi:tripartite tricarboxylate transporter substrate binding protein [Phyllobacterium sp. 0TCS1.6C]|jgi:putative tricarboxylic transport membrane protein|uniref:Bug family tripartite tricarboxylate transporter substrate binding protein n=1 Tax=unclassified Phyllobacterium TaxID=2638441 RepID=UPI0022642A9C|nr:MULTISPECIES: tripartite tricarboxylate transporter substrate binding protein [unclassified Phyllobacterium]MCX8281414.1 tripartite tricarboxylate transporter substrate binding protein [Phyllobacterium sp. 0TCS1.6C]MCX8295930.1 tripartite tricarboxylate transporter substrate binding protein [Phyllobacterium sp. 0TCS1.6A]
MLKQITLALALAVSAVPALAFEPTRPVEFVVTSGPGGGTDNFARTVQAIIGKHKLMKAPIVVTNKGGGSGAEGFVYAAGYKADPYKLTFGTNNEYLLPSVAEVPYAPEDLTPVAAMALDEFLIWVNGQSEYADVKAFLDAAKAKPQAVQFGGSQSKDTDQILVSSIGETTGAEFRYIPFKSGGEAGVQLAGGHIDANVNNPNENRGQWQAGMVKPLCVFRPDRFPKSDAVHDGKGWHDIPTCAEAGLGIDSYRMPRTVWLPGGVDAEAVAFYQDVLKKVSETPEWAEYIAKTSQTAQFMAGDDFKSYQAKDRENVVKVLEREGWLVK